MCAVLHYIDGNTVILKFGAGFNKSLKESLVRALKLVNMELSVMNSRTFQQARFLTEIG